MASLRYAKLVSWSKYKQRQRLIRSIRALLISEWRPFQPGVSSLVAFHVVLQVVACDKSFSTARFCAGVRPFFGVRSRVLLQVAFCGEKPGAAPLATIECVSWANTQCQMFFSECFGLVYLLSHSLSGKTPTLNMLIYFWRISNLCEFFYVQSACRGWRRLLRRKGSPRKQKASLSCVSCAGKDCSLDVDVVVEVFGHW